MTPLGKLRLKDFLLNALLFLLILEIGSFFGLKLLYPNETLQTLASKLSQTPKQEIGELPADETSFIAHPYFGLVFNNSDKRYNNYGFDSRRDFPLTKEPGECVAALLGNSVAAYLADFDSEHHSLSQALDKKLHYKNCKKWTLVNLARPMDAQPQQFFVASYFSDMLDLAINLDGVLEAKKSMAGPFPLEYPQQTNFLFSRNPITRSLTIRFIKLLRGIDTLSQYVYMHFPVRNYSASAYFLRFWTKTSIDKVTSRLTERVMNPQEAISPFYKKSQAHTQASEQKIAIWKKYTKMQSDLLKSRGVPLFIFNQPLLSLPNTKKLTSVEQGFFDRETEPLLSYPGILQAGKKLKAQGLQVFDLTHIFDAEADTIYVDDFHVNDRGQEILSEKIASLIAENLKK